LSNIKTISHKDFKLNEKDKIIDYQSVLTKKLDLFHGDFDQKVIDEIILWKVNRYVMMNKETLDNLNSINPDERILDYSKTKIVLTSLLGLKGVRLPMASTFLRFKNKYLYQIIDQRVYRIINGKTLKTPKKIDDQITLYLEYLDKLKESCKLLNINFENSDRILYNADRSLNKHINLINY